MRKGRKLLLLFALLCLTLLGVAGYAAAATANATITVSTAQCENGDQVTVTVTVKAGVDMAIYGYEIAYDTSILEYRSGADVCDSAKGVLKVLKSDASGTTQTLKLVFKAKKVGTAKLTLSKGQVMPQDPAYGDNMSVTLKNGSITVKAPYQASNNASLASLQVGEGKLSPAFSKTTYSYTMNVGGGVSSVTVSAKAADSKAKIKVSGNTKLKEGKNTVTVVVTAEDGKTTKTYQIVVTRAKPSPTPSPTITPTKPPTPTPTQGVTLTVGENKLMIADTITAACPEGFEPSTMEYQNITVPTLESLAGDMILVQLSDKKLYIYDQEQNQAYPFRNIQESGRSYILLQLPENVTVPEGYHAAVRTINGAETAVYEIREESAYCLVYAMNWNGEKQWYQYDTKEDSMQRFPMETFTDEGELTPSPTPTCTPQPTNTPEPTSAPTQVPEPTAAAEKQEHTWNIGNYEIVGLCVIGALFILTVLFLCLYLVERSKHGEEIAVENVEEHLPAEEPAAELAAAEEAEAEAAAEPETPEPEAETEEPASKTTDVKQETTESNQEEGKDE